MAPKPLVILKYLSGDIRITAPLLFATLYCPEVLQRLLPQQLAWITSKPFIKVLGVLAGLSTVQLANSALSKRVLNNHKSDAKFVKSTEVVLVTGGASGIGALIATRFAGMGVKVAIIDVTEPKESLRKSFSRF